MDKPKKTMGRPPVPPDEKLVLRSIRLKATHWAKIDRGGYDWLRKLLDRAKPPAPKE
ncbi:hypothetical protein BH09PSE5_BH09PSE5_38370 [soil metagenome]